MEAQLQFVSDAVLAFAHAIKVYVITYCKPTYFRKYFISQLTLSSQLRYYLISQFSNVYTGHFGGTIHMYMYQLTRIIFNIDQKLINKPKIVIS